VNLSSRLSTHSITSSVFNYPFRLPFCQALARSRCSVHVVSSCCFLLRSLVECKQCSLILTASMVFDTSSPPASSSSTDRGVSLDRMFNSSAIELPLSDERDLSQIEAAHRQQPAKWKMVSKRRQSCTNDMYATAASRYHRFKPPSVLNPISASEETVPSSTPFFASVDKCHSKYPNDDVKSPPTSSASITTRRSTTDCNNLFTMNRRATQGETTNPQLLAIVDEESRDSIWPPTGMTRGREKTIETTNCFV
jgi:hypothetical protein